MIFDLSINPRVFRNLRHCLAFGFGAGLAKKAPGTWGTLAAVPFCALLMFLPVWLYALLLLAAFALGVWLCETVAQDMRAHDHGGIVWDEMLGYWLTLFLAPINWVTILMAFVLFRLFDIWKPWPISWCDRHIHGGLGIMLDDVLAGALAGVCLQALLWSGVLTDVMQR